MEIQPTHPTFDELPEPAQNAVKNVCSYFNVQFDNDEFGPFLEETTPYSIDTVSVLVPAAIGTVMTYCLHPGANWDENSYPFTVPVFEQAFEIGLKIEVIREYIIGYVEIPDTSRVGAPDVVRRDYLNRWQTVLNDYMGQLKDMGKKLSSILQDMLSASSNQVLIDWASTPWANLGYPFYQHYEKAMPWWSR